RLPLSWRLGHAARVVGPDVAGAAGAGVPELAALVGAVDGPGLAVGRVAGIDRRASDQQRERLRRAAVGRERAQVRIDRRRSAPDLVAVDAVHEAGTAVADADQVVAAVDDGAPHGAVDSAHGAVARDDRV